MKAKELINLPVETKSGHKIGRLADFEVDDINQKITTYFVKSHNPIKGLFKDELIISNSQVISLDKEKMIVDDNAISQEVLTEIGLTPEEAV